MSKGKTKTACVRMTGPDVRMDLIGDSYYKPANPLPAKCPHCTFPDLDFVPQPYLLTKGISSPAETSPARLGNLLVRDRIRRVLEVVVPDACTFYPTAERKTKKATPWWLTVPMRILPTTMPKSKPPFCSRCGEPKVWACAMGPVWAEMSQFDSGSVDIFKTANWYCPSISEDDFAETNSYRNKSGLPPQPWSVWGVEPPAHEERWTREMISKDLYFSVRLEQLLKRAKVKGQLVRSNYFKDVLTTSDDEAWIEEKLKQLSDRGLAELPKAAAGNGAAAAQKWFKQFLKRNARKGLKKVDFAPVEKKQKLVLPQGYKDFISSVGPMSFEDVIETSGFTANILPPAKLDFKDYRRGRIPHLDDEQSQIDGVMFADTDHGDAFVFDVSAKGPDYPVYWHDHEQNTLEPFAPNFAECIKRFAQKN